MTRTGFAMGNIPNFEIFDGKEYDSWKRKVRLNMRYMDIYYTVLTDYNNTLEKVDESVWKKDEQFCRDYLLSCLSDTLATNYSRYSTAKEIWDRLEALYKKVEIWEVQCKNEEESPILHLVDKFMSFKFEETKDILPQVGDLENIVLKLRNEKVEICDTFLAGAIIYKLPVAWDALRTKIYRKKKRVGLDKLKRYIKIEDEISRRCKLETTGKKENNANIIHMSQFNSKSKTSTSNKREGPSVATNKKQFKKRKSVKCYRCSRWGHFASDCAESSNFVGMIRKKSVGTSTEWYSDSRAACRGSSSKGCYRGGQL